MMEETYGGLKPGAETKATRGKARSRACTPQSRAAADMPVNGTRRWGCSVVLLLYVLAALGLGMLLMGCTTTRTVPVETVRTEYRDRDVEKLVTDTVRDTRLVWVKGDTVVDIREKERIRSVEIHDTCYVERRDSVPVPYPVERPLNRWEQAKMDLGGFAIGALVAILSIAVIWLIKKFGK